MVLTAQGPEERVLKLLPLLEDDAPWLAGLAHQIMSRIEGRIAGTVLSPRVIEQLFPLEILSDEALVIVPFSIRSHLSGTNYLQLLGFEALLREGEPFILTRPQPMLSEFMPFSLVGGWSGASHAGIKAQVIACPGWDTNATVAGPIAILRHPTQTTPSDDQKFLQWMQNMFISDISPSMDIKIYIEYLTRTLVQTLFLIQDILSWRTHA